MNVRYYFAILSVAIAGCTTEAPRNGVVLDAETHAPVDSAEVRIYPPLKMKEYPDAEPVFTQKNGAFSIPHPLPEDLLFSVDKPGYTTLVSGLAASGDTIYLTKSTP